MIISHKHKFIFIKPTKVAGTSIEVFLSRICSDEDIITPISPYSEVSDKDKFQSFERNFSGFFNHIEPEEIKKRVNSELWDSYLKITVTRNPWDIVVSRFFWEKNTAAKNKLRNIKEVIFSKPQNVFLLYRLFNIGFTWITTINFSLFIFFFKRRWTNQRYYFDNEGKPYCDFYIRYEFLAEDLKKLCDGLKIPYDDLPRIKSNQRKEKIHYSKYYSRWSRKKVGRIFKKEISEFKYSFEQT